MVPVRKPVLAVAVAVAVGALGTPSVAGAATSYQAGAARGQLH